MNPQAFILIGRSGCGKGTQAGLLKPLINTNNDLPILHIETGNFFREFVQGESYSSHLSQAINMADDRQPDFLACFMWTKAFTAGIKGPTNLILDGVSRSANEARLLDTALAFYGIKDIFVIHIDVTRDWSAKHLLARGRSDDATIERINKRLDWFDRDVVPSIEYYRASAGHHFIQVNGEQSIEQVHADIVKQLTESV